MTSRNRSFKFDNDTKKFFVNGREVSDGTSDSPISANLSTTSQSNITAVGNLTSLSVAGTTNLFGNVVINSTAAASSTATGAFRLAGGAGIAGNLHAGNVISTGFNFANGSSILSVVTTAITTANTNIKGYTDNLVTTANTNIKGYVDGQITNLVNGAPATLDTLNELATALGNDANLSVTITNQIANVNSNIGTANTNMKGYVDAANTIQSNQIAGANSAIATANTNMKGYVDGLLSTITANTGVQAGLISSAEANIITANTNMRGYVDSTISSNVTVLGNRIDAANSAISTANTNMKGYVDGQISTTTSAVTTANTNMKGYVDGQVSTLTANAGAQAESIATLNATKANLSGAVFTGAIYAPELFATQSSGNEGGQLNLAPAATNTTISGNVVIDVWQNRLRIFESGGTNRGGYFDITTLSAGVGSNLAVVGEGGGGGSGNYSNANVASYLVSINNAVLNDVTTANTNMKGYVDGQISTTTSAITTANTNMQGYVDAANTIQSNQIAGANSAISTANTNMKGYVDGQITTTTSAISTANTNMKGYVDGQITSLVNGAPSTLDTLKELATALGNDANLSVTITNQIANVNSNISTANTNMKGYVDSLTYGNTQVSAYLPTYNGNIANLTLNSSATIFAGNATANITVGATTWGPDPQNQKITIGGVGQKIYFNGNSSQYSYMDDDEFYIYDGKNNATAYYKANQFALNRNDYTAYFDAGPGTITIGAYVGNDRSFVANLTMVRWGNTSVRTTIDASGVTTNQANIAGNVSVSGNLLANGLKGSDGQILSATETGLAWVSLGNSPLITDDNGTTVQTNGLFVNVEVDSSAVARFEPSKLTVLGNVQATKFIGDGSLLTNVVGEYGDGEVGIYLPTHTGNIGAGNVNATNLYGTIRTAAQTNITSVGNLTSLSTSGIISTVGVIFANSGAVSNTTSSGALRVIGGTGISGDINVGGTAAIVGNLTAGNVSATNLTGTVRTAAQPSITSLGTLTSLAISNGLAATFAVTANSSTFTDTVSTSTSNKVLRVVNNVQDLAFSANLGQGSYNNLVGAQDAGIIFSNGTQGQGNLTIGPWISGTSGIRIVGSTGQVTVPGFLNINSNNNTIAIQNGGTNGVGNIGASGAGFNTVFARATSAQYADLAEIYTSDREYVPGTVLIFGGEREVTVSTLSHDPRVAGVVSTNPAYIMNNSCDGVEVALQGRVPTKVQGPVAKGDRLVTSSVQGAAERLDMSKYQPGCIIGKALEDIVDDSIQTIEVVVGRV